MKNIPTKQYNSNHQLINTAVVGYGLSGQIFHAPFLQAHPTFSLHNIVSSGVKAHAAYPSVQVVADFEKMLLNPEIQLVVLCTPHHLHASQAIAAMEAGKDVVIEKPVAMSSDELQTIMQVSMRTQRTIFPYHNRRWDGDFLTIKELFRADVLGQIIDFESRFDRFSPVVSRAEWRYTSESGGGTLFDLGPHLIDQALHLFGKPSAISCQLSFLRKSSKANDSFDLKLFYPTTTATLKAGIFVSEPGPRFQLHGMKGSFVKYGLDPQEARLKKGMLPSDLRLGKDRKSAFGILHLAYNERVSFPTIEGHYMGFYDAVAETVLNNATPAVKADDALLVMQVIETALCSNQEQRTIYF